jgi:hypothetical protein
MSNPAERPYVRCAVCGQTGHARSNSTLCPRNPKRRRATSPSPSLQLQELEGEGDKEARASQASSSSQYATYKLTGNARSTSTLCSLNPKRRRISSHEPRLKEPEQSTSSIHCSSCGLTGHARSSSTSCPLNTKQHRRTLPSPSPDLLEIDIQENDQPENGLQEDDILMDQRHPAAFVEREQVGRHHLGRMDQTCPHCNAKLWVEVLLFFSLLHLIQNK